MTMIENANAKSADSKPKFYAKQAKIHPRKVEGTFRTIKTVSAWILLIIYFFGPFLRWDRGPGAPDQAILIDLPGRRAYFFDIEIWPQEVYYLTGLLLLAAIGLFLVSALAGRIWCGFACWQTVYTDLFQWVERVFEGDRNKRIAADRRGLTPKTLLRKAGKHIVWLIISTAVGVAFLLYFDDAFVMLEDFFTGQASSYAYVFALIIGGFCYLLAGFAREQVCIYMCPYSRFQAAMFDEHSLIVSYEAWRGEPRGPARKGQSFEGRGHCLDCRMCVQACPTGVDIREGNQLACIGCALCIDACNSVMDRYGLPRGLISYDSTYNQMAREKGQTPKYRLVRARTVIYTAIMVVVGGIMVSTLLGRATTEINVLHERSPLFVRLSDGDIRNKYVFKVLNMVRQERRYHLELAGIEGARMSIVGGPTDVAEAELAVDSDTVGSFHVLVTAPPEALEGKSTALTFILTDDQGGRLVYDTLFAGPER